MLFSTNIISKGGNNCKGCVVELTVNPECEQPRICEKVFEGINEKFKVNNHRIEDLEQKVDNLSAINATLVELKLLSEQNIQSNKGRDEMLRLHSESLVEVTSTLKEMNKEIKDSKEQSEKNINEIKIKVEEISKDNNIKISDIAKNILFTVLGTSVGVGITLYITKLIN